MTARILIVAQRLPVTVEVTDGGVQLVPSAGGVATGLAAAHRERPSSWVGWPGPTTGIDDDAWSKARGRLEDARLVPVRLTADEERGAYEGYANAVLWPLFHYETNLLPLEVRDFEIYRAANERFADAVVAQYRAGDLVWIHDYQLLLVPRLIRDRIPDARIGFFLHIPFPSSEVFRALPHREALLDGMLAADLIGFHTAAYMRHFVSAVQRILGAPVEIDRIRYEGRVVQLGVFPMGIDARWIDETSSKPSVIEGARALRRDDSEKVLLGIDRLDYTKGISRRLLAFERLLERHEELRGRVRMVQVGVPSREGVEAYQAFRSKIDELVGRIDGTFATPDWVPIHWIHRGLSHDEVIALYRAADVMLVTPLRDGMNLVAKEYVASRGDGGGVLVLSEFAGAASELAEAMQVNPYDVETTASTLYQALTMPIGEMRRRMRAMRRRVFGFDTNLWVDRFVRTLTATPCTDVATAELPTPPAALTRLADETAQAERLVLLLDYDGTLAPIARTPDLAAPDEELIALLGALCRHPHTETHVVSGRSVATLQAWLGDVPVGLHAEHGIRSRDPGASEWEPAPAFADSWREPVLTILREFAERAPGSLVEEKDHCVAWHYRAAEPVFAEKQARELRLHLLPLLSNEPVELIAGRAVLEIRPHGFHKGRIVERIRATAPPGTTLLTMGDDDTDEDMFAAIDEETGLTIHVGPGPSRARVRIASVRGARAFLHSLLTSVPEAEPSFSREVASPARPKRTVDTRA